MPRGLFKAEELRGLSRPSTRLNKMVTGEYIVLILLFIVYVTLLASTSIAWLIVWFVSLSAVQYWLLHAAHESVHQDSRSRAKYSLRNKLLLYWPLGLTSSFRDEHLAHHRHFGDPLRDPDISIYQKALDSRLKFAAHIVEGFVGLAALRQIFRRLTSKTSGLSNSTELIALMVFHLSMIFVALSVGHLLLYLAWVLSLSTVVKGLSQLRGLAEHGRQSHGPYILRSFLGKSFLARFLGNTGFRHHAEHHLYPTVPFDRLDAIRQRLLGQCEHHHDIRETIEYYNGNHLSFLMLWCKTLPKKSA